VARGGARACAHASVYPGPPGASILCRRSYPSDAVAAGFLRRWAAAAWLATEKRFRRIMGYQHLWILKSYLDDAECDKQVAASRKVG